MSKNTRTIDLNQEEKEFKKKRGLRMGLPNTLNFLPQEMQKAMANRSPT